MNFYIIQNFMTKNPKIPQFLRITSLKSKTSINSLSLLSIFCEIVPLFKKIILWDKHPFYIRIFFLINPFYIRIKQLFNIFFCKNNLPCESISPHSCQHTHPHPSFSPQPCPTFPLIFIFLLLTKKYFFFFSIHSVLVSS